MTAGLLEYITKYYGVCMCKAVWAGWGHASEYPKLPEVLRKHNIAFMGKMKHLTLSGCCETGFTFLAGD